MAFPSYQQLFTQLKDKAYVNVPFPIERETIEEIVRAFMKFLELPDEIKKHIDFTIAPNHRRGDVGYKQRNPNDVVYNDSKDFFHFHPAIFEKYQAFIEANSVIQDFFVKAMPLWTAVHDTVYKILETFEPYYPGTVSKIYDTKDVHILLRFLKYNWKTAGKNLAKPHYDAGSFTLAMAESCSGLRIGTCPDDLKPVHHKKGKAIFMLSSNYAKVINTAELPAGWHDVIQEDDTLIGRPFARWAVVAFIEAHGVTAQPQSETHKWDLQYQKLA